MNHLKTEGGGAFYGIGYFLRGMINPSWVAGIAKWISDPIFFLKNK